jgi:hypothetical protein
MTSRLIARAVAASLLLAGCTNKLDLGNLPDGGSGGAAGTGSGTAGQGGPAGSGGGGGKGLSSRGGSGGRGGNGGGGANGGAGGAAGGGAGGASGSAGGGSGGAAGGSGGAAGGSGGAGGAPACRLDADCTTGPGVCLLSGVCATAADVIYVENTADLSVCGNGNGTLQSPVCNVYTATSSFYLSETRATIIVRGSVIPFYIQAGRSFPILIVGQANGAVSGNSGAVMGITLYGGDVTLRHLGVTSSGQGISVQAMNGAGTTRVTLSDVSVTGNVGAGVIIDTGTFVHMDGCWIQGNDLGITVNDNAAFQIENTVVASNGGKGVTLGASTASVTTFRNNTVVGNNIGITCGAAYNIAGSIVYGNGIDTAGLGPFAGCAAGDVCLTGCSALDPMLDETMGRYTLTAASPAACKDQLDTAPATDRKGTPRPQGPKSDCGSDEYVP